MCRKKRVSKQELYEYENEYKSLFDIEKLKDGYDCNLNIKAFDKELKLKDIFTLLSSKRELDGKTAFDLYQNKAMINKAFSSLQSETLLEWTHMHNLEAMHGKLFVMFIGLILRSALKTKLASWANQNNLSLDATLVKLMNMECKKQGVSYVATQKCNDKHEELIECLKLPISFVASK